MFVTMQTIMLMNRMLKNYGGFLVATDVHPVSYDICKIPAAKFLRIRMRDETARTFGHEPCGWRYSAIPLD